MVDVVERAIYSAEIQTRGMDDIESLLEATRSLDTEINKVTQSTKTLASANDAGGASAAKVTVNITNTGKAIRGTTDDLEKMILRADRAAKANAQLQNSLAAINRIESEGGDPARAQAARVAVNKQYEDQINVINRVKTAHNDNNQVQGKAAVSAGQLRYATQNLTFQLNDVATSLASGAPPARVFAQQMGQIIQVFQQGGGVGMVLGNLKNQIIALINPYTAAAAVTLALAGAIGVVINRIENLNASARTFRTALGPIADDETVTGLQNIALALTKVGFSFAEANKQAALLARNPIFSQSEVQLSKVLDISGGVATRMGTSDITAGYKELESAIRGGADALVKLGSDTRSLNADQATQVRATLALKGNYEAMNQALAFMQTNLKDARDKSLTPMQRAMEDLTGAWNGFMDRLAKSETFQGIHNWFLTLINDITNLLNKGKEVKSGTGTPGTDTREGGAAVIAIPPKGVEASQGSQGGADYAANFLIANKVRREGLFPQIADISSHMAEGLPQGWRLMLSSVGRDRSDSSVGSSTQHRGGRAGDFQLIGPDGHVYPVAGENPQGLYTEAYNRGLDYTRWAYPDLARTMRSGSLFDALGRKTSSGRPDLPDFGHFDFLGGANANTPVNASQIVMPDANEISKRDEAVRKATQALRDNTVAWNERGPVQDAVLKFNETLKEQTPIVGEEKAKQLAWIAYSETITKAQIELKHYNEEQKLGNDLAVKTTQAYEEGIVPGLQAAAEEQAKLAALQNPLINAEERKQLILKTNATQAMSQAAAQIAQTNIEITHEGQLATAAGVSAAAYHDKQVEIEAIAKTQEVYNKALATGDAKLIATAKHEQDVAVAQAKKLDGLKQSTAAQNEANKNIDQTAVLQKTIELQGQTSEEIQYQVSLLQIRQRLANEFANAEPEARKRFEETSVALAKSNLELAKAQREQQKIDSFFVKIGDTIDQNITQRIVDAFDGKKAESFATTVKNAFKNLIPQIISSFLVRPVIGSVLGSLGLGNAASGFGSIGGTLSGIGNLFGSSGGASSDSKTADSSGGFTLDTLFKGGGVLKDIFGSTSSGEGLLGGVSNFFGSTGSGLGGIFAHAPTAAEIASGVGPVTSVPGSLFPSSLGGTLGGIGGGFAAGSLLNSVLGGNQVGGTIGSGVGAIAGSFFGPIGSIIGGAAGGALGGMFGSTKKPDAASGGVINLGTGQISNVQSGGNAQNDATANQIGTALAAAVTRALAIPGARLPGGAVAIQAGSRDGIKLSYAGQEFKFADASQAITAGLIAIRDHLEGVSDVVHTVLNNVSADPAEIEAALAFAAQYEKINEQFQKSFADVEKDTNVMGPFATAMDQIKTLFQQLTDQANKFGLSLDPINGALAEATKRLQGDFMKALNQAFDTAQGKDYLNQLEAIAKARDQQFTEAEAIGIGHDSVATQLNAIASSQAITVLKDLTSEQLQVIIDAMRDTRPEFSDMARAMKETVDAANAAAAALADLNHEMERQAAAYDIQQNFDTASGEEFLAQIRDLDKARKAAQANAKTLDLGDTRQGVIQETQHRATLTVLQALTNEQLEKSRAVLAELNPAFADWVDEAYRLIQAQKDSEAATQRQIDLENQRNQILEAGIRIREYINAQNAGPDYTSPTDRLASARGQFATQIGLAQGGDVRALQGITGIADQLKAALQAYFASSQAGAQEWEDAKKALALLPGVPNEAQTNTNAIIVSIQEAGAATVAAIADTGTATTQQIVGTTIAVNQAIVDNARQTARDMITETGASSSRIVDNAINTSNNIVQYGIDGSAKIVGATTSGLELATAATIRGANDNILASKGTTDAVNYSATVTQGGTLALLASNQANAATLIAGSKEDTLNLLAQQEANAAALLAAGASQSAALVDQNARNAEAVVNTTNAAADKTIAQNDIASKEIIATAQATSDLARTTANDNTANLVWTANATSQEVAARNDAVGRQMLLSTQADTASMLSQGQQTAAAQSILAQATTDQQIAQAAAGTAAVVATANAGTANLLVANENTKNATIATAQANTAALGAKTDAASMAAVAAQQAATGAVVANQQAATAQSVAVAYDASNQLGARTEAASQNVANQTKAASDAMVNTTWSATGASVTAAYDTSNQIGARTEAASANVAATTKAGTDAIVARADAQIAALQALTGMTVGDVQVVTAIYNTASWIVGDNAAWSNAIYGQIAAYGTWTVQSNEAWSNAIVLNIAYWGNAVYSIVGAWSLNIYNQIAAYSAWIVGDNAAWSNAIVNNIAGWSNAIIGTIAGWSNLIVETIRAYSAWIVNDNANWNNAIIGTMHYLAGAMIGNEGYWSNAIIGTIQAYGQGIMNTVAAWGSAVNYTTWFMLDIVIKTIAGWGDLINYQVWAGNDKVWNAVGAWGNAICGTIGAWGNATVNTIAAWSNGIIDTMWRVVNAHIDVERNFTNAITNSIFATSDTAVVTAYGNGALDRAAMFANGDAIIGAIGSMSISNIAITTTTANSIVAAVGILGDMNGAIHAIYEAAKNSDWWSKAIYDATSGIANQVAGLNGNMVAWDQNIYNITHAVYDRLGWLEGIYNELHLMREYINLLTEVTIQYDVFMAAKSNADRDALRNIEDTLRRNAFG